MKDQNHTFVSPGRCSASKHPFWVIISAVSLIVLFSASTRAQPGPATFVAGDFNKDGMSDAAGWRDSTHSWIVYLSCGKGFSSPETWTGMWGSDGQVNTGDLNGDGRTDLFMWRAANNTWSINLSTGNGFDGKSWTGAWGSDGPMNAGDLNADGKTDVFMWRGSDKVWTVNLSTGSGFRSEIWKGAWGSDGPIHVGDLNGDGKTDVFMWRNADKVWTVNLSTGSGFRSDIWKGAWGSDGPINVGDLNGDRRADVFMWRDADKVWTVNLSTGSVFQSATWNGAWGSDGSINVGDLDGDGKTDVFMWRNADRVWTVNLSSGSGFKSGIWNGAWGSDGPILIGDLNNDGKTDVFMWRAADNTWSVNLVSGQSFAGDTWSALPTPVLKINSIAADKSVLTNLNDAIVVRYSLQVPSGCIPRASYSVFTEDRKQISTGTTTTDPNTGEGSLNISGYRLPVQFQFYFNCNPNSACQRAETVSSGFIRVDGPPTVKIVRFEASGNGLHAADPEKLYVPVGTKATLSWQVENCDAGCEISLEGRNGLNYGQSIFTKSGLQSTANYDVSPVETFTKYILNASAASGRDSKLVIVQLYATPSPCTTCSWYYFKLTSPPDRLTPECFTYAVYAADEATAKAAAQAQATNYTVTKITESEYYSGCR